MSDVIAPDPGNFRRGRNAVLAGTTGLDLLPTSGLLAGLAQNMREAAIRGCSSSRDRSLFVGRRSGRPVQ
jgi:hypothetical protein